MPTRPFAISKRIHPHHFPVSKGGGQADHMRYINGRPFYFEWFWNAEGAVLLRVRTLVPNPTPYLAEGWETIHELTNY
ncbi:hypothetical protein [Streptomyces noursei]|uniref:hypothetical protein n=1 Tax=Streptomyces noursei TaxID=1971 RepID=UPI001672532C|nr:hypothetical protein [Streptomyces noursei]MCZ1014397.1 hypothetical protein [Streptomyces noursei]GGW94699.1 hypothetical protein GCM10010341_14820 [Streptomyces noursei]